MMPSYSNAEQPTENATVTHEQMSNAIRALSMDAVEKANSGHPGMPMGMADVATVLFTEFLKFDPSAPHWADRDRFILSAGHGSMLLYSLLYLTGYEDITLDQLRQFRQWGARTCGHPEYGEAAGIETTTGPLGQGIANAVGMAMAERLLEARYGTNIVNHYTYALVGDGCLMEGISQEAISMAGHLKLGKLIVLFDDNHISIDGPTELTTSEDQPARFKASGWDVQSIDGHDAQAIRAAIAHAQTTNTPSLIACRTTIAKGAPTKAGTSKSHGAPLGEEEIKGTRDNLNWPHAAFEIPEDILSAWRTAGQRHVNTRKQWEGALDALDSSARDEFQRTQAGALPKESHAAIQAFKQSLADTQPKEATRKSSANTLEVLTKAIPELIGGSADLTGSNLTQSSVLTPVTPDDFSGRYIYYGVREHAMCAAMNGMALHKGVIPYGGTFFVFTDYCRPSIRLAALMKQRVIYVMTHDSIGLGEDGPTHQPVEHLASLRAMPNLNILRPADATETLECWQIALEQEQTPSMLVLSRQNLPSVRPDYSEENRCAKGGYILSPAEGKAQVTLIATGSEVSLALDAQARLKQDGIAASVVSMPCTELFDAQPDAYKQEVLGGGLRVAIEAGTSFGWERYIGNDGIFIGLDHFGASAPAEELFEQFGITAAHVVNAVKERV